MAPPLKITIGLPALLSIATAALLFGGSLVQGYHYFTTPAVFSVPSTPNPTPNPTRKPTMGGQASSDILKIGALFSKLRAEKLSNLKMVRATSPIASPHPKSIPEPRPVMIITTVIIFNSLSPSPPLHRVTSPPLCSTDENL